MNDIKNDTEQKTEQKNHDVPHDSRTEFKQRLKSVRYRAIGALIIMSMFYGTLHIKLLNPMAIPNYMEKKYHKEFEFVGNYTSGDAVVSPKDEPTRRIVVEVEGKMPWDLKYVDHYYGNVAEEYIQKRVEELSHSQYATEVYCLGINKLYYAPETQAKVESKYTLEDVKKGPEFAPDAYESMGIIIHFFGPAEHKETMIKEMHEIFKVLDSEFKSQIVSMKLMVVENSVMEGSEELKKIYKTNRIEESFLPLRRVMDNDRSKIWMILIGDSEISRKQANTDYQYFRTINDTLYDKMIKGVQQ